MNYLELFDLDNDLPVNKLTIPELAYIAGIVDGEGCIFILHQKSSNQYIGGIKIALSDSKIIPWLSDKLNKNQTKVNQNPKLKTISLYSLNCVGLLIKIIPYLILKKDQAELVLDLIYCQKTNKNKTIQENIYKQMKELRDNTYII
jgi:hypothetical protein